LRATETARDGDIQTIIFAFSSEGETYRLQPMAAGAFCAVRLTCAIVELGGAEGHAPDDQR